MYDRFQNTQTVPISVGVVIGDDYLKEVDDILLVHDKRSPREVMVDKYTFQQWINNDIDISTIDTSQPWEQVGDFLIARQPSQNAFNGPVCVFGISSIFPSLSDTRVVCFSDGHIDTITDYESWRKQYNRNLPQYTQPIPDWPNQ